MKKKTDLILFIAIYTLISSCSERNLKPACDLVNSNQSILVYGLKPTKVNYQIDNRLIEITEGFSKWGPDKIRKYAFNGDTMYIEWYDGSKQFNCETSYKVIEYHISHDSIFYSNQKLEEIKYDNVCGVLSMQQYKNKPNVIFSGINTESDVVIKIDLETPRFDEDSKEKFKCMLRSFQFYFQTE